MNFNDKRNPYVKYQDVRFSTLHRGTLVVMLYDGAIRFLEEAKARIKNKDIPGKGLFLDRAFSAINELRTSLNFDSDRKLADSLNQIYFYMTKQLSRATMENDIRAIDVVIDLLKGLKEAWTEAAKKEINSNAKAVV